MKRYARLKGKMLLLVVLGTLLALAAALVLWEVVVDGLLQDAFARGVLWACQNLFGYDEAGALEVYQTVFRNHKGGWLALLTVLLMLAAFYLALGRFTRWLDQIGAAVRQVMAETGSRSPSLGNSGPWRRTCGPSSTPWRTGRPRPGRPSSAGRT